MSTTVTAATTTSTSLTTHLTILTILSATTIFLLYKSHRLRHPTPTPPHPIKKGKIFFISQTNTSKNLSHRLHTLLTTNNLPFDLVDPKDYDPEDLCTESLLLFVVSTWGGGKSPRNGVFLEEWLSESGEDFRVGSLLLKDVKFAVFGVGSGAYGAAYNAVGRAFSRRMRAIGAVEVLPLCEGDVDEGNVDEVFGVWSEDVVRVLKSGELSGGLVAENGENVGEVVDGSVFAYIILRGKRVPITEIHSVESRCFSAYLDTSFDGKIPIKIRSRCLQKALDFCEKRPTYPSTAAFDRDFLDDVLNSDLNLIHLIHAAGRLAIDNLFNLLFDDVVDIICSKKPEEIEKIFKIRYNGEYLCYSLINELLNGAPPCPTLSKEQQEYIKLNREAILNISPDDFQTLPDPQRRYWVYAHLVMKCNTALFFEIHEDAAEDDEEEEEEEEEEESKVPKNDDDVRLEKKTTG